VVKRDPFFLQQEIPGEPNTETLVDKVEVNGHLARYRLKPLTGKQHQLRVHMASLGCPILNDPFYPELLANKGEDYSAPLQLLAKTLEFTDPITGEPQVFESQLHLKL
jgi:tRNA pseudouridine32 synthase/23S rRNA pseudouridine746 synthase